MQLPPSPWYAVSVAEAAARLGCAPGRGLDADEAVGRLDHYGPNRLAETPPVPAWRAWARQFKGGLIAVLLAAAVLAGVIGDTSDMVVILAVVLFNASLGFWQEHRVERILAALKAMLAQHSVVRRGGVDLRLASDQLVPGDVVLLAAGDRVPADGRLVEAQRLEIDESTLTGESAPVAKSTAAVAAAAPLAERGCAVFLNTVVTRGRGVALVTETGPRTEIGRVAGMIQATADGTTPLQRRLDQLGHRLATIAAVVVAAIMAMGLARGEPLPHMLMTAIALAVAAIPEGLPAVVTVTLAIGMARMIRRGAIVKRLSAVETLGSTTVICCDKTGTLTANAMTARVVLFHGRRFEVDGPGGPIRAADSQALPDLCPLFLAMVLCNDSVVHGRQVLGDPTEGALLALAAKGGVAGPAVAQPRLAEIPFDATHKFMATFHDCGAVVRVYLKGAPDVLLDRAARLATPAGAATLDPAGREAVRAQVAALGGGALRVLAVATAEFPRDGFAAADLFGHARDVTLLGLVGLVDPPRAEAREAIAACHQAGIRVCMITGDHLATAAAVARDLGLPGDAVHAGDLAGLDDAALAARVDSVGVFARVSPADKVRIVRALQARGHVVAMTGDGVNDAAALKAADIGVAMGRAGSDVTREAAAMVLTDDNFATVVGAVREGRTIYDNIVKFVRFQLSTNVGALLTVFAAPLLGLPVPFHPIQILWVNIIMDGPPAMALAFDPPRPGLMRTPPRPPSEPVLTRHRLVRLVTYGATMMVGTLVALATALTGGGSLAHAQTLAFTTFVLFQLFNAFNARVGPGTVFHRDMVRNPALWIALAAVLGLQILVVTWPPAQALFHTTALAAADWAMAAGLACTIVVFDEVWKLGGRVVGRWRRLGGERR